MMEFLVEFEVNVPDGTPVAEVKDRENAEASVAAKLVDEGHLVRLWNRPDVTSTFEGFCSDPELFAPHF
jgi:muconolactone delta-isomerase